MDRYTMISEDQKNLRGRVREIEAPQCANCDKAMRHSCTEEQVPGVEIRVYQCVACASTQSIEMAAG
jgi:hypothetical protein